MKIISLIDLHLSKFFTVIITFSTLPSITPAHADSWFTRTRPQQVASSSTLESPKIRTQAMSAESKALQNALDALDPVTQGQLTPEEFAYVRNVYKYGPWLLQAQGLNDAGQAVVAETINLLVSLSAKQSGAATANEDVFETTNRSTFQKLLGHHNALAHRPTTEVMATVQVLWNALMTHWRALEQVQFVRTVQSNERELLAYGKTGTGLQENKKAVAAALAIFKDIIQKRQMPQQKALETLMEAHIQNDGTDQAQILLSLQEHAKIIDKTELFKIN